MDCTYGSDVSAPSGFELSIDTKRHHNWRLARSFGNSRRVTFCFAVPTTQPCTTQLLTIIQGSTLAVFRYPENPRFPDGIPDSPEQ